MKVAASQNTEKKNRRGQEPPLSWPEGLAIEDIVGQWWVAHAKPRQEKVLAWDILHSGGAYFLPMYETVRRSRGRRWKSILPLFTGYVFLCGEEDDRLAALKTNRIVKLIDVQDQARIVEELSAIKRLIDLGMAIDPHKALKKGVWCRIRSGPLAGLEGKVESRKSCARFIVQVSILGQGAAVEIDADLLEPIA